jgi:acyl-CoA synthetase (AMP-forming)/AMP-acid ligase II
MGMVVKYGHIDMVDGRDQDFVNGRGEDISSMEVDGVSSEHTGVLEAAVIAVPHNDGEKPRCFRCDKRELSWKMLVMGSCRSYLCIVTRKMQRVELHNGCGNSHQQLAMNKRILGFQLFVATCLKWETYNGDHAMMASLVELRK